MALRVKKSIADAKRWRPPTGRDSFLTLDLNENYSLYEGEILQKFKTFGAKTLSLYPEYDNLLGLLSGYTGLPAKNIVLTNGADQAIGLVSRLFWGSGDKVIIPSPIFSIYYHELGMLEAEAVCVPYINEENGFEFPFEETLGELNGSQGLVLCNPNNPLGPAIPENQIEALLTKTHELNIPCVIDEAYFEFYGKTSAPLVPRFDNLIIVRTFSKVFGLAGLRVGYVLLDNAVREEFLKLRQPWSVNHFSAFAAEIVLENKEIFLEKIPEFNARKEKLVSFLKENGFEPKNTAGNFFLVKPENKEKLTGAFREAKILVNDVSLYWQSFGLLDGYFRITMPGENDENKLKEAFLKAKY